MRGTFVAVLFVGRVALAAELPLGVRTMDFFGYRDCPAIENAETRVILCPQRGGMVLAYAWQGKEAIPLLPGQEGWTWKPGDRVTIDPYGGRFDIGPEYMVPPRPALFYGPWQWEATGARAVRLTSPPDETTGVQLIRDFRLAATGSHLRCTQTIRNVSDRVQPWCHWSRTFGLGDGICVVPLNPQSRFPRGYVTYGPGSVINFAPEPHANVRVRDGCLEIRGNPPYPKFGLDTEAGWLAYAMPNDILFVKRFPVYHNRVYNEIAAITVSIFYWPPQGTDPAGTTIPLPFCELEPIGPRSDVRPGKSVSFTEDWWLLPFAFPQDRELDLNALRECVAGTAR